MISAAVSAVTEVLKATTEPKAVILSGELYLVEESCGGMDGQHDSTKDK